MTSKPGIYRNVPFEDYLALPYESNSWLKRVHNSPRDYRYHRDHPEADTDTEAKLLGRAEHMIALTPDDALMDFTVYKQSKTKGKGARKNWEAFKAANADKCILSPAQWQKCVAMRDAVRAHNVARSYLDAATDRELTIVWDHDGTGIRCKSRLDLLPPDAIVDLKTAADIGARKWGTQAARLLYHMQGAFYREAVRVTTGRELPVVFIVVQSGPPFDVAVRRLTPDQLGLGHELFTRALEELYHCRREGLWAGRYETEDAVTFPAWAMPEAAAEVELVIGGKAVAV